jgi:hypothetical protein
MILEAVPAQPPDRLTGHQGINRTSRHCAEALQPPPPKDARRDIGRAHRDYELICNWSDKAEGSYPDDPLSEDRTSWAEGPLIGNSSNTCRTQPNGSDGWRSALTLMNDDGRGGR